MILKKMHPRGQCASALWQYTSLLQTYSKIFSETALPIKDKFNMKSLQEKGINMFINILGHMTKMAAMPICGKNPSKNLLRNWWNETGHVLSVTRVLQCVYKL